MPSLGPEDVQGTLVSWDCWQFSQTKLLFKTMWLLPNGSCIYFIISYGFAMLRTASFLVISMSFLRSRNILLGLTSEFCFDTVSTMFDSSIHRDRHDSIPRSRWHLCRYNSHWIFEMATFRWWVYGCGSTVCGLAVMVKLKFMPHALVGQYFHSRSCYLHK